MDAASVQYLNRVNREFYTTTAPEFDQTRQRAWPGWIELAGYLSAPLTVLDVGCGNGRFGVFLADTLDGTIVYHGLDNNPQLLAAAQKTLSTTPQIQATLRQHDIIEEAPIQQGMDLVVLFGVLHHIPGAKNREAFLQKLVLSLAPGGLLCFAGWRFYEYERFRRRFAAWPEHITREEHDYLLDWRRGEQALRYCHYVDDTEHARLISATGLEEIATFRADGSDNRMNRYSVLRK